uniref:Uncharacterized protein AlNc14C206G8815 n=1 Tax=Albugo laibachii Nc14 TaxID=890382 RepID=F0WR07_9STRA|nr:conserved hypothetical protein [Albugo laibachii Nc14]|eukprot:CCA23767.1 conserved hypothetical protein [Albugo laibachii Nc14]
MLRDPWHAHSFVVCCVPKCANFTRPFSEIYRNIALYQSCCLCSSGIPIESIGKRSISTTNKSSDHAKWREFSLKSSDTLCQCLLCGIYIHRKCLSKVHAHRFCRHSRNLDTDTFFPHCENRSFASKGLKHINSQKIAKLSVTFLVDLLLQDSKLAMERDKLDARWKEPKSSFVSCYLRRFAPVLMASGVVGAVALGPAAGLIAALSTVAPSAAFGMEALAAGVGISAAFVSIHNRPNASEDTNWAMEICRECQLIPPSVKSDAFFKKDVEFLHRFTPSPLKDHSDSVEFPSIDEVYRFFFDVFASRDEALSHLNAQFFRKVKERHTIRTEQLLKNGLNTSDSKERRLKACRETFEDVKMYVAHVLGVVLQMFPSFTTSEESILMCSEAVERVIFDGLVSILRTRVYQAFEEEDQAFCSCVYELQKQHFEEIEMISKVKWKRKDLSDEKLVLAEDLMEQMIHKTHSPLLKLKILCESFRQIASFADTLYGNASSADILVPILCLVIILSTRIPLGHFVSEMVTISYFMEGGGKGAEGYVLTTFEAMIQIIATIDRSILHDSAVRDVRTIMVRGRERVESIQQSKDVEETDEFYDAQSA